MNVLEKYGDTIETMVKEAELSVQLAVESYSSCQNERKKLEVRLKEVKEKKQKWRWQFMKVAWKLFLLMIKPKDGKIEQAMTPVNEYLNCSNKEKVLKEQIIKSEDSETIAQQELQSAKDMLGKLQALKG